MNPAATSHSHKRSALKRAGDCEQTDYLLMNETGSVFGHVYGLCERAEDCTKFDLG